MLNGLTSMHASVLFAVAARPSDESFRLSVLDPGVKIGLFSLFLFALVL